MPPSMRRAQLPQALSRDYSRAPIEHHACFAQHVLLHMQLQRYVYARRRPFHAVIFPYLRAQNIAARKERSVPVNDFTPRFSL